MNVDAIIFDKDGTLMDFDSFWLNITHAALKEMLKKLRAEHVPTEALLTALGVQDNHTEVDGVLCYGTYRQMGDVLFTVLHEHGCVCTLEEVRELTVEAYHNNISAGIAEAACSDIHSVLQKLRDCGLTLAVVTTDDPYVTKKCLQTLEIASYFDVVYTHDGILPPKPDPFCIFDFCKKTGFAPEEIVMVGDTMTDIRFAANGGIRVIGVAKSERSRKLLETEADAVVQDISCVYDVLT